MCVLQVNIILFKRNLITCRLCDPLKQCRRLHVFSMLVHMYLPKHPLGAGRVGIAGTIPPFSKWDSSLGIHKSISAHHHPHRFPIQPWSYISPTELCPSSDPVSRLASKESSRGAAPLTTTLLQGRLLSLWGHVRTWPRHLSSPCCSPEDYCTVLKSSRCFHPQALLPLHALFFRTRSHP